MGDKWMADGGGGWRVVGGWWVVVDGGWCVVGGWWWAEGGGDGLCWAFSWWVVMGNR